MQLTRFSATKLAWGCAVILGLTAPSGYAVTVSVVGAIALPGAIFQSASGGFETRSAPLTFGGGLLLENRISRTVQFEWGVLSLSRGYQRVFPSIAAATTVETNTFSALQVPALIRVYPVPAFSLGFGVYYARGLGSISVMDSNGTRSVPFGLGSLAADDYGFALSLALNLDLFRFLRFVGDIRYLQSASNVSRASGQTVLLGDLQGFVGIKFGVQ